MRRYFLCFCLGLAGFFLAGEVFAQNLAPFDPLSGRPGTGQIQIANGLRYEILLTSTDRVLAPSGETIPIRKNFDFLAWIAKGPSQGPCLWINHETADNNDALGDGGGASILPLEKNPAGGWSSAAAPIAVDFAPVGGTWQNCLGGVTPWGTILTSEEYEPANNATIYRKGAGVRDTSMRADGRAAYLHYGWMVEADVQSRTPKALRKLWALGRFSHESALVMPDGITVYMTDDFAPGVFFKFMADKPRDLSAGTLYAYRMSDDGAGAWIPIPPDMDSLAFARDCALRRNATIFFRIEDVEPGPDGKLYITETGRDSVNLKDAFALGGRLAPHLKRYHTGGDVYRDYYGRILRFDPETFNMEVWLEGGFSEDGNVALANPDNLCVDRKRNGLIVCEDLNDHTQKRGQDGRLVNELFWIPFKEKPTLNDARRILIAPFGAETTGPCFDPDYSTLFLNIQHPDKTNAAPFSFDLNIGITGFRD